MQKCARRNCKKEQGIPMQWEYLIKEYLAPLEKDLNTLGSLGWELVEIKNKAFADLYIFKRSRPIEYAVPKPPKPTPAPGPGTPYTP
jgi:hypothetical protein